MFPKYKLLRRKQAGLLEVQTDLQYIQRFKSFDLGFDEAPARKRMAELKPKEDKTADEDKEYAELVDRITNSRAVKAEYEKLIQLESELKDYISLF